MARCQLYTLGVLVFLILGNALAVLSWEAFALARWGEIATFTQTLRRLLLDWPGPVIVALIAGAWSAGVIVGHVFWGRPAMPPEPDPDPHDSRA